MNPDIFPPKFFSEISFTEFELLKKQLHQDVFNRFFKEGTSRSLIASLEHAPSSLYKFEAEKEITLGYEFSLIQKERLLNYFSKNMIDEKLNEHNEYFKVVKEQVETIDKIIGPVLKELDIDYKLHLTGGGLRDHLLNQTENVKDLDILIEFNDKLYVEKMSGKSGSDRRENQKKELLKFFEEKEHVIKKYNLKINIEQSREKILHEIVFQLIKKDNTMQIKDFFLEQNEKQEEKLTEEQRKGKEVTPDDSVIYDGLFSVLKVNNPKFKYPIDLLLNSNKFTYINNFDFDICKCSYSFEDEKEASSLYIYDGFIKDVIDKKLSLNSNIFYSEKQIDRCFKDHYLRLKNKYADHDFFLIENKANNDLLPYIKKSHLYHVMENKFPESNNSKIKTKKI